MSVMNQPHCRSSCERAGGSTNCSLNRNPLPYGKTRSNKSIGLHRFMIYTAGT